MTLNRIHWMSLVSLALAACVANDPENLGELTDSTTGGTDSATDPSGGSSDSSESVSSTSASTSASSTASTTSPGTSASVTATDTSHETESESETQSGSSDTGEPIACVPEEVEHFPAGCPDAASGVQLPAQGCYVECAGVEDACDVGRCILTQVDPCPCADDPELCCDACTGEQYLCIDDAALGGCTLVLGRTFTSVEELECGLGPNGPELCNWSIAFAYDGTFLWMHSDVGEGGSYACDDGTITIADGPMVEVAYDADSDLLTWDGVQYE